MAGKVLVPTRASKVRDETAGELLSSPEPMICVQAAQYSHFVIDFFQSDECVAQAVQQTELAGQTQSVKGRD